MRPSGNGASSVDQHLHVIKEMSAVSGACLMTRRDVYEADERYRRLVRSRTLGRRLLPPDSGARAPGALHATRRDDLG